MKLMVKPTALIAGAAIAFAVSSPVWAQDTATDSQTAETAAPEATDQGAADADAFYRDICEQVRALIPQVAAGPAMTPEQVAAARAAAPSRAGSRGRGKRRGQSGAGKRQPDGADAASSAAGLGTCPICKQGEIVESPKAWGCARWRDGCGFTIWKTIAGHGLTPDEVTQLIERGHTEVIDGFRSKAGKPFAARLRLDGAGKVGLDFAEVQSEPAPADDGKASPLPKQADTPPTAESLRKAPIICPQCGKGRLIEGRQAFGCERWREGCDYRVPKATDGRRLTEAELRTLVAQQSN